MGQQAGECHVVYGYHARLQVRTKVIANDHPITQLFCWQKPDMKLLPELMAGVFWLLSG